MKRLARIRPSSAIALIALFIALGGTAVALPGKNQVDSGDIKNNQIGSKDLRNNDIRSKDIRNQSIAGADVKNGSLTGADVDESTLGAVPTAANAANAANAVQLQGRGPEAFAPAGAVRRNGLVKFPETGPGSTKTLVETAGFVLEGICSDTGANTSQLIVRLRVKNLPGSPDGFVGTLGQGAVPDQLDILTETAGWRGGFAFSGVRFADGQTIQGIASGGVNFVPGANCHASAVVF